MPHIALNSKQLLLVVGIVGLAIYHGATGQYSILINDVLTLVAATHYGPLVTFLHGFGLDLPAAPGSAAELANPVVSVPATAIYAAPVGSVAPTADGAPVPTGPVTGP